MRDERREKGAGRRAQSAGHRGRSSGIRAQSTGRRAQGKVTGLASRAGHASLASLF